MEIATIIAIALSVVGGFGAAVIVSKVLKPFMRNKGSLRMAVSIIVFLVYGLGLYILRSVGEEIAVLYHCLVWIPLGAAIIVCALASSGRKRREEKERAKRAAAAEKERAAGAEAGAGAAAAAPDENAGEQGSGPTPQ